MVFWQRYIFSVIVGISLVSVPAEAKLFKKIKDKVEVTGGWDRYIHSWGDYFVPDKERWVAIRSIQKKKKEMGYFWDVKGKGKVILGAKKPLMLWPPKYKFQKHPAKDMRYRMIPVWEENSKNPDDFGYYYLVSGTGQFAQWNKKNNSVWLNSEVKPHTDGKNYWPAAVPKDFSFQWKIENVGKNKFRFYNRANGKAIGAKGGKGNKKSVKLVLVDPKDHPAQTWGLILIAQGKEVKSTKKMIGKRANEISAATKKYTKQAFNSVEKLISSTYKKAVQNATNTLAKGLMELTHDKKNKRLFLRVGVDNPLDALMKLKEKTLNKFVKIDLKTFKFEMIGLNKIKLSLINSIGSMGKSVNLTVSFVGNWSIGLDGFKINNLKMERFSIPFFPDNTTKGIRTAVTNSLKKVKLHLSNYPGKNSLKQALNGVQKPKIVVENVQKTSSKFMVQLKY